MTTLSDIEDKTNPVIIYTADIPNTLQLVDLTVHKIDEFGNPIEGVVFNIVPTQDIVFNGKTVQKKGESVGTIVTDSNGYAETGLIYLGKYEVKEISAPFGYVQNTESEFVELTYAGQEIAVRDTVNTSFENDYQSVEISLSKAMETDDLFNIGTSDEYKNVRFGLFAAEDITAADGTVIPADGLISEVSLNEDLTAKFDTALPFGKYYVQEISTDESYILNGEKYLVNFEYMGQKITTVNIDCGTFVNEIKRGSVHGIKVNENDEPLENAAFGLFRNDCTEFVSDNAIMTAVSDENGNFEFDNIPYGEYIVCEIVAPTGYIFSKEQYFVIIDEDGNVIEKWISTDEAHLIEGKLIAGKEYTLRETIAPEGYEIASEIKFTLNEDGTVTEVIMYDEVTPIPETPHSDTPSVDTPTVSNPHTGSSANNSGFAYLATGAVILVVGIFVRKKRDDR